MIGSDVSALPGELKPFVHNFVQRDFSDVKRIREFTATLDRLDCLVNNAAVQVCKEPADYTEEDFDFTTACNVLTASEAPVRCRSW